MVYSYLNALTGLLLAAFQDIKLIVKMEINTAIKPAIAKIHHCMGIL